MIPMNSLQHSPKHKFWHWIAKKLRRLDAATAFVEQTDERYLDANIWSRLRGIPRSEAANQLQIGVQLGLLEECLLYEWNDSPVQFIVPANYLGRSVRLSDIGYIGDDDQDEILISENRVRKVFIGASADT
jgi:hypothetical protein